MKMYDVFAIGSEGERYYLDSDTLQGCLTLAEDAVSADGFSAAEITEQNSTTAVTRIVPDVKAQRKEKQ